MSYTKIVLNRQSDLILDNAQITNPQGIVLADISGVSEAVASINTASSAEMSTETSARVAGDASLTADLSSEASRAVGVENYLSSAIINNEDAISTEASNRVEGDVSVTAAMSAEISTRIVAETSLQNNIDAEASTGLVRDNAEASMARAAEQSLATDLDAEQSRAESAEASLNAKVENVISNVDPAAIDSLTEIVSAFQSADGDINNAITNLSNSAVANVSSEASTRLAADQSLAGDLSSEIADREAAVSLEEAARISGDASVNADLSTEVEARISDVNAEQARAESAEASLTSDLSVEYSNRVATDDSLAFALSIEISNRAHADLAENEDRISVDISLENKLVSADNSIAAGLSSELVARASADTTEASIRLAADNSIAAGLSSELVARASAITAEASSRVSGDASLATVMSTADASLAAEIVALPETDGTTIIVDAADNLIKLKDTVDAPVGGTRTFGGLINVAAQPASLAGFGDLTLITKAYLSGQVSTEASTRVAGDASIAANLSTELVARASADASIAADLSTELVNRDNAVKAEIALRVAGDSSLATDLSSELVARASADTSIAAGLSSELVARASAITSEASDRVAGDVSLQNQIDFITSNVDAAAIDSLTEIVSAFQSADGDINGAITALSSTATSGLSTEVAARESADASLFIEIESEVDNRSAAQYSIDNAISTEISERESGDLSIESIVGYTDAGDLHLSQYQEYLNFLSFDNQTQLDGSQTLLNIVNQFNSTNLWSSVGTEIEIPEYIFWQQNINGSAYESNGSYYMTLADANEVQAMYVWLNALQISYSNSIDYYTSMLALTPQLSPANLVNFEAWKRFSESQSLETEVAARESADASLDAAKLNLAGGTMSGAIDMNGQELLSAIIVNAALSGNLNANLNIITNLLDPTNDNDATNKYYVDSADQSLATALSSEISRAEAAEVTLDEAKLNLAGGTMSGNINMGNNYITGVNALEALNTTTPILATSYLGAGPDTSEIFLSNNFDAQNAQTIINLPAPTNNGDAANKLYVDSADQSLATALSSEISRAEAAEDSLEVALSSEVSYLIANTDLGSIDSFAEVVYGLNDEIYRAESAEGSIVTSVNNLSTNTEAFVLNHRPFMMGFNESPNGTNTVFTADITYGTQIVFLNGLTLLAGEDYYATGGFNGAIEVQFNSAPASTDRINIYGVDSTVGNWNGLNS